MRLPETVFGRLHLSEATSSKRHVLSYSSLWTVPSAQFTILTRNRKSGTEQAVSMNIRTRGKFYNDPKISPTD